MSAAIAATMLLGGCSSQPSDQAAQLQNDSRVVDLDRLDSGGQDPDAVIPAPPPPVVDPS